MRVRGMVLGLAVLAGCGRGAESYQGRATWSVAMDGKVQNTEQVEIHQVMGGKSSDLVVVSDNCDLPANSPDGTNLTVLATPCITWRDGQEYDLTLSGQGQVSQGRVLSLSLSGPITIHTADGDQQGTFTYQFHGDRL